MLVGDVPEETQALVRVTRECFFEGIRFARPGCRISDIAKAIQAHAESHGYGVVRELVGHGIGRDMHVGDTIIGIKGRVASKLPHPC